jgi:hypothetical protein
VAISGCGGAASGVASGAGSGAGERLFHKRQEALRRTGNIVLDQVLDDLALARDPLLRTLDATLQ